MSSRSKKSKHRTSETPWSEWSWDEAGARWYRSRYDARGSLDYEYEYVSEDTTKQKGGDNPYSPGHEVPRGYAEPSSLQQSSYEESAQAIPRAYAEPSSFQQSSYEESAQEAPSSWGYQGEPPDDYSGQHGVIEQEDQSLSSGPAQTSYSADDYQSKLQQYSSGGYGADVYSMTQAMATTSIASNLSSIHQSDKGKGAATSYADYAGYDVPGETAGYSSGYSAPTITISHRSREAPQGKLDSKFQIHRSKDFKFGRIFNVLWTEPTGPGASMEEPKIFHFLIVKHGHDFSTCLRISSYGGQGTLHPGVNPADHAVVYSSRTKGPSYLHREDLAMATKPIRIEILDKANRLASASRLNYAQLYTVEHAVKVQFIGEVAPDYLRIVSRTFNERHSPPRSGSGFDSPFLIPETDDETPVQEPIPERPDTPPEQASYYPRRPSPRPDDPYPPPMGYDDGYHAE